MGDEAGDEGEKGMGGVTGGTVKGEKGAEKGGEKGVGEGLSVLRLLSVQEDAAIARKLAAMSTGRSASARALALAPDTPRPSATRATPSASSTPSPAPAVPGPGAVAPAVSAGSNTPHTSPQLLVLVVDDSPMSRKMLIKILKKEGCVCEEAEDGVCAVDMVSPQPVVVKLADRLVAFHNPSHSLAHLFTSHSSPPHNSTSFHYLVITRPLTPAFPSYPSPLFRILPTLRSRAS